ncbi:MAG: TerB family tellurite resistance protein [Bacteroidota bacterium]
MPAPDLSPQPKLPMPFLDRKSVDTVAETGTFLCPQCDVKRPYRLVLVEKILSLAWFRLRTLEKQGEYVECQVCRGTFNKSVLEEAQDKAENDMIAEYEKALKHSLVLMLLADGEVDEREKTVVLDVVNKYSYRKLDMAQLDQYIAFVQQHQQDISAYLKTVSPILNKQGKAVIIRALLTVAAADDHIASSEMTLLYSVADVLGWKQGQVRQFLQEIMAGAA